VHGAAAAGAGCVEDALGHGELVPGGDYRGG